MTPFRGTAAAANKNCCFRFEKRLVAWLLGGITGVDLGTALDLKSSAAAMLFLLRKERGHRHELPPAGLLPGLPLLGLKQKKVPRLATGWRVEVMAARMMIVMMIAAFYIQIPPSFHEKHIPRARGEPCWWPRRRNEQRGGRAHTG